MSGNRRSYLYHMRTTTKSTGISISNITEQNYVDYFVGDSHDKQYIPANLFNLENVFSNGEFIYFQKFETEGLYNEIVTPSTFIARFPAYSHYQVYKYGFRGTDEVLYVNENSVYVEKNGKIVILMILLSRIEGVGDVAPLRLLVSNKVFINYKKLKTIINSHVFPFISEDFTVEVTSKNIMDMFFGNLSVFANMPYSDFSVMDNDLNHLAKKLKESISPVEKSMAYTLQMIDGLWNVIGVEHEEIIGIFEKQEEALTLLGDIPIFVPKATIDFNLTDEEEIFIDKKLHELKNKSEAPVVYEGERKLKEMEQELQIPEEFFTPENDELSF